LNSTLQIASLPRLSELLSDLFQQLQLAGLFFANLDVLRFEATESSLSQLWYRRDLLHNIADMLESWKPSALVVSGTPAISNTVLWHSGKALGGYAGTDLSVSLSDLLASYRGCWRHAIMYPAFTFTRFTRLGFWYWRERDDVFAALDLLLNMYKNGFFLRMKDFGSAIAPVCNAFTTGLDLTELWNVDFNSKEVDAAVFRVIDDSMKGDHAKDRVQMLIDWASSSAIEQFDLAREASSLDLWLIAQAQLYIMVDTLTSFGKMHSGLLSATQRVIVSQFEEIRCDLGSVVDTDWGRGKNGSPFLFHLSMVYGVGFEYQQKYGCEWLDKMIEDRGLLPDVLRESAREAYSGADLPAIREIALPVEWRMPSESIGSSFCAVFNRDPSIECSFEFDDRTVAATCRALGHAPQHDAIGDKASDFSYEAQSEARRKLSVTCHREEVRGKNLLAEQATVSTEEIAGIGRLFPWNPAVLRHLGMRNSESGDTAGALRQMRAALLFDPSDNMVWHCLSKIFLQMGSPNDAKAAEGISRALEASKQ
jgi:hypothetical protein